MKFTEDEAYKELVAQMTNNGKSPLQAKERTLKAMLKRDYAAFVNEETELSAFIESNIALYNEYNGEARANNSAYYKLQEELTKLKEGMKPIEKKEGEGGELEALIATVNALKDELETSKKEKSITQKRSTLTSTLKEKGIKDEEWITNILSEISITDDIDIDTKADKLLEIYNKGVANNLNNNTPSNTSSSTDNSKRFKKYADAFEAERKEEETII